MATLLYGSGMRLLEVSRLRITDIYLVHDRILVCDGKGQKDRVTLLPRSSEAARREQIDRVRLQHK